MCDFGLRERRTTRTDFQAINEDLTEERMKPQKYTHTDAYAYAHTETERHGE